ncbi:MAG: hypothetical protein AVDCRST_MAG41-3210, partial [uncultured Corynebacteriales bacterium]
DPGAGDRPARRDRDGPGAGGVRHAAAHPGPADAVRQAALPQRAGPVRGHRRQRRRAGRPGHDGDVRVLHGRHRQRGDLPRARLADLGPAAGLAAAGLGAAAGQGAAELPDGAGAVRDPVRPGRRRGRLPGPRVGAGRAGDPAGAGRGGGLAGDGAVRGVGQPPAGLRVRAAAGPGLRRPGRGAGAGRAAARLAGGAGPADPDVLGHARVRRRGPGRPRLSRGAAGAGRAGGVRAGLRRCGGVPLPHGHRPPALGL